MEKEPIDTLDQSFSSLGREESLPSFTSRAESAPAAGISDVVSSLQVLVHIRKILAAEVPRARA